MRKALVLFLAALLAVATIRPAMAGPPDDAPFTAGGTAAGVLSLINSVGGDDSFATMDVAAAMSSGGSPTQHYGPFPGSSGDSGTCGINDWAQDTFERHFTVRQDGPNTFTIVEQFKNGSFITNTTASPGGCDTDPGGTIRSGVTGPMHGYFVITLTGTQTSHSSSCGTNPCTTTGFITTHFAGAFTIGTFFFHYTAGDQSLFHGEWKNASCDRGGNQGDVASTGGPLGLQKSALCP